jgi:zona occludens toxin (predicted ATPase)
MLAASTATWNKRSNKQQQQQQQQGLVSVMHWTTNPVQACHLAASTATGRQQQTTATAGAGQHQVPERESCHVATNLVI